jgi:uncharacterized protein with LGFP repeats
MLTGTNAAKVVGEQVNEIAIPTVSGSALRTGSGTRVAASLTAARTASFRLVAVTWDHGSAARGTRIEVRTGRSGRWTAWQHLDAVPSEGPAAREDSSVRDGTEPLWVDQADGVDVRVIVPAAAKAPAGLEVAAIDPGVSSTDQAIATDPQSLAAGEVPARSPAARAAGHGAKITPKPRIISREEWGADPSLGDACWAPKFGRSIKMVFIHHTAGSNTYRESDSAAIVRSIYAYHTSARGWCDIGYNFLVDKYGNVFEGRRGGERRPVRGAHSGDYNVNTAGISLMGNFEDAAPTAAMKNSLVRLVAWRLATSYVPAEGTTGIAGKRFNRISGHRDAMQTACPGQVVYDWLPRLRARVAAKMGNYDTPIYKEWQSEGGLGGTLRAPFIGERWVTGGRLTVFDRGRIYWSKRFGAHELHGALLDKYRRLGGIRSRLGYPRSDVVATRKPGGAVAAFDSGRIISSGRGSHQIYGLILVRYHKEHGIRGKLGFPVADPHRVTGGLAQRFQKGTITWDTSAGTTTVEYTS